MTAAARVNAARTARGFTMVELLVVLALVAIATGVAVLALRDPASSRLEREAARLAALLEGARAESRALGVPVLWTPTTEGGFRFVGLPAGSITASGWLEAEPIGVKVYIDTPTGRAPAPAVRLGPEPVIGPQHVVLSLGERQLVLSTDGIGPFAVSADPAPAT